MGPGGSPVSGRNEIYFRWLSRLYDSYLAHAAPRCSILFIKAAKVRVDGKSGQCAGNLSPLGNGQELPARSCADHLAFTLNK